MKESKKLMRGKKDLTREGSVGVPSTGVENIQKRVSIEESLGVTGFERS